MPNSRFPITRARVQARLNALGLPVSREEIRMLSSSRFRNAILAALRRKASAREVRDQLQAVLSAFRAEHETAGRSVRPAMSTPAASSSPTRVPPRAYVPSSVPSVVGRLSSLLPPGHPQPPPRRAKASPFKGARP